jgi:hypothetical protein
VQRGHEISLDQRMRDRGAVHCHRTDTVELPAFFLPLLPGEELRQRHRAMLGRAHRDILSRRVLAVSRGVAIPPRLGQG